MTGTTRDIKCPECGAPAGKACCSLKSDKPLSDDHAARRLISINEAAKGGIVRLRKPQWSNPMDHVKIDVVDGEVGPWIHLYAPFNKACNGRDPVDVLIGDPLTPRASLDSAEFEIYAGPAADSDEYQAEAARCSRQVAETNVVGE